MEIIIGVVALFIGLVALKRTFDPHNDAFRTKQDMGGASRKQKS